MKILKLATLVGCIFTTYITLAQVTGFRRDNILLPEKLIITERIQFDSIYAYPLDSFLSVAMTKPFFEIKKNIDFTKLLAEKVLDETISVNDASQYSEFYPYSVLNQSKKLNVNEVLKNLGQDTFKIMTSDGSGVESLAIKAILLDELSSINFIEDWAFSTQPFSFQKNVIALEPIRRYVQEFFEEPESFRYRKVFRFYNPQNANASKTKLTHIARVKYEHFFNLSDIYFDSNFHKLVEMCLLQNEKDFENNTVTNNQSTPFFNAFNQRIFINTLLGNVFEGKAKATEFESSKVLTPNEARSKVFEKVKILITNTETWLEEERTVENDNTSQIQSVIFIEDWYFDNNTFQFQKKVVGIAPVRYFHDSKNGEFDLLNREILFTVQF